MTATPPPIVLDTNVVVAGVCRRESTLAYSVLPTVLQRRVPLILTEPIIAEYEVVLSRPGVRTLTRLTPKQNRDRHHR